MTQLDEFTSRWHDSSDYISAHTSGSTGTPKEIRLLKADMRSSARATNTFFGINPASVLALPLSLDYIAGKMMAVRAFEAGCRLHCLPVSNTVSLDCCVDLLAVVPSQIPSLLADPDITSKVGCLLVGGAPLDENTRLQIKKSGLDAFIGYGMTETCSHVALRDLNSDSDAFTAMPGISFSTDERGCLVIHSHRFSWRNLVTNDLVELHSPTSFTWLGRHDNVINSGGIKIHPERIEAQMLRLNPTLTPFYIAPRHHDKWGEVAVIVAEHSSVPDDAFLAAAGEAADDPRTAPRTITRVDQLPRTSNGKLRRK